MNQDNKGTGFFEDILSLIGLFLIITFWLGVFKLISWVWS